MKTKINVPANEQELHINYCPTEMGKMCEVYTTIPWLMRYLERLVNEFDSCRVVKDDQYSYTVQIPFKLIKPRKPRIMSDEQRQAAATRMREARKQKEELE